MVTLAAIDDGHSHVKAALLNEDGSTNRVSFESAAKAGAAALMDFGGGVSAAVYTTEGHRYTIGPRHLLAESGLDTRTTDYPLSQFNRVLVAHALHELGIPSGGEIEIATGLPIREWVMGTKDSRVEGKTRNLEIPVTAADGWERPALVRQHVFPEAISAYVSAVDQGVAEIGDPVAVVDIGGRTMDVALIQVVNGRPLLNREKSGSEEIGALAVRDRLRALLAKKFELDQVPDIFVDQAMSKGRVRVFNKDTDCRDLVKDACRDVQTQAANAAKHRIGQGADLSTIILVGGGSHLIDLSEEWPHAVRLPEPEFANVEGMLSRLKTLSDRGE